MWPMQMTSHAAAANLPTEQFMQRERRRLEARHIWEDIQIDWPKLQKRYSTSVQAFWERTRDWFIQNATAVLPMRGKET